MKHWAASVALAAASASLSAQPPANPVQWAGRVVRADSAEPLANVRVTAAAPPVAGGQRTALTDADGRFAIESSAAPGRLRFRKTGFSSQDVEGPSGDLLIRLHPAAAIAGRIIDDAGEPVVGVRVVAEAADSAADRLSVAGYADTDDTGSYRIGGLPANERFLVSALTVGTPAPSSVDRGVVLFSPPQFRTFYPGSLERAQADVLMPPGGGVLERIDLVIPATRSANQPLSVHRRVPFTPPGLRRPVAAAAMGRLRGRVIGTDGRPIVRAEVLVLGPAAASAGSVISTGIDGQFAIDVPAGELRLTASKAGFSLVDAAGNATLDRTIAVKPRETVDGVELHLAPWSSLSGTVRDEFGDPMQGVTVQLWQVRYQSGRRMLAAAGPFSRQTDDRGIYRLFGIAPGGYIVTASAGDLMGADWPGYALTYYPGSHVAADARYVGVERSRHVGNIDIDLQPQATFRVSGTMRNAAGEPTRGGAVRLITSDRERAIATSYDARIAADGQFEFRNVTPGTYVMQMQQGNRSGAIEGEFASLVVAVSDADVAGLAVQASIGSTVTGRVTFEGTTPVRSTEMTSLRIRPVPVDFDQSPSTGWAVAEVRETGEFRLGGLHGPRRLSVSSLPAGWTLRAVRVAGIDVTDRSLPFGRPEQSLGDVEIVLTDRVSAVTGSVVDGTGRPVPRSHVVVFAVDRARWYPESRYLRVAAVAEDGTYLAEGLPAGAYYAAAVDALPDDGPEAWQDAEWLDTLLRFAASLTLGEGERRVLQPLTVPTSR